MNKVSPIRPQLRHALSHTMASVRYFSTEKGYDVDIQSQDGGKGKFFDFLAKVENIDTQVRNTQVEEAQPEASDSISEMAAML